MHGQYRRLTEQAPVDMKETFGWLKAANLPGAIERLMVAAQDQALRTRYYEHHTLHRDRGNEGYNHPHCKEDQSQPTGHLSQRQEG